MLKKLLIINVFLIFFILPFSISQVFALETFSYLSFEKIVLGKSTEQDIISLLGKPTKDYYSLQKDIFWYLAENGVNFHTIIFNNKIATLITIHLPFENTEDIKKYGIPDKTTYNLYRYDTKTYIFGSKGLALTADGKGKVLVKQKFVPQTVSSFLAKWGKDYPETNPYTEGKITLSPSPYAFSDLKTNRTSGIYLFFWELSQKIKDFFNAILFYMVPTKP